MDKLTKLAIKYNIDRHPGSKHGYTPVYYGIFRKKVNSVKKVLEIGVAEGGGLRMWRDFFPYAKIYGMDNDKNRIWIEDRIETILGDQSSARDLEGVLERTGADIDFVVDDGSHDPCHQLFTCVYLMPKLKKDVIYIIEDVNRKFIDTIVGSLGRYKYEVFTHLKGTKTRDNRLIVVRNYG